ncbi:MAG: hypothetical protein JST86_03315 [Bacteroidetes bacterium]|nr:hypothetical protein [Bacteroidota bacterium]
MKYSRTECPVETYDKEWIDDALVWFEQRLGSVFVRSKKILIPADCRFEYTSFNSHEAIDYFVQYICNFIQLDAQLVTTTIIWNDEIDLDAAPAASNANADAVDAADGYDDHEPPYQVQIFAEELNDFDKSFVDLASRLVYIKLKHENTFSFYNVHMNEIAMALFGFGILMTNIFIRTSQWGTYRYSYWKVRRLGCINNRMFGYLLARLVWMRGENTPNWVQYLNSDTRNFFVQSFDYLHENDAEERRIDANRIIQDNEVFITKRFYENGKLFWIAHIIQGMLDGKMTFFHANGHLWSERIYKDDKPYTVLSNFNKFDEAVEKGTLTNGNGTLYIYKPDGNLLRIETYANGGLINKENA